MTAILLGAFLSFALAVLFALSLESGHTEHSEGHNHINMLHKKNDFTAT